MRRLAITLAAAAAAAVLALGTGLANGRGEGHGHSGGSAAAAAQNHDKGKHKGSQDKNLFAVLRGANEISPTTGKRGAGDPDGRGGATITIDGTAICWGITVTNLSQPIAAHIHKGKRNQNGPIVVPLSQPATGDPGASSGCTMADPDLAQDIQRHPRRYYVNVHTVDFPNGAARGQLKGKKR
jgi:CHRD domain